MTKLTLVTLFMTLLAGNTILRAQNSEAIGEEWYLETEDKKANLYVREVGKGVPVVVLHGGWGSEHSYLLNAVKGLEKHFRFVFYDQRGSLRSPCKLEFISLEKHVQDLERLRKELKIEKMTIFAHSMGTRLALFYLQRYPQRVKTMALAGALPAQSGSLLPANLQAAEKEANVAFGNFFDRKEVLAAFKVAGYDKANKSPKQMENKSARQMMELWRVSYAAGNLFDLKHTKKLTANFRFYNEEVGIATLRSVPEDFDFTPLLAKHPFPITVINGDHDLAEFGNWFYTSQEFRKAVPNVKVVILKNTGHIEWMDDPVGFTDALMTGLKSE